MLGVKDMVGVFVGVGVADESGHGVDVAVNVGVLLAVIEGDGVILILI